jgi:hypothetical protein
MKMKIILSLLLFCAVLPAALAQGGGISDLFRSVTGAIGGKETAAPAQKGETAVLGVRGMDEGDAKTSAPAAGDAGAACTYHEDCHETPPVPFKPAGGDPDTGIVRYPGPITQP